MSKGQKESPGQRNNLTHAKFLLTREKDRIGFLGRTSFLPEFKLLLSLILKPAVRSTYTNTMNASLLASLFASMVAFSSAQIDNNMKALQNMALPTLIPLPNLSSLSKNLQAFSGFLPNQQATGQNFQQFQQPNDPGRIKEKIPCTCGVFLSGQFKKGSQQPPNGNAVLLQELADPLACGPIGEKQCVNKCLESMVRHLPNSGPMICGSIDRDCFKERAYLFIKNCNDAWINSNLSAGREYCCKDGLQYKCPTGLASLTQVN